MLCERTGANSFRSRVTQALVLLVLIIVGVSTLATAGRRTRVTPPGALPARFTVNTSCDALVFTRDGDLDSARATVTTYHEAGNVATVTDAVGNRIAWTVTGDGLKAMLPNSGATYNVRDQLGTDTYDANGNTLVSQTDGLASAPAAPDVYDFEDRLIARTRPDLTKVFLAYDADGIRIGKTILDASSQLVSTTSYLVCTNNLTGYAQVLEGRTACILRCEL